MAFAITKNLLKRRIQYFPHAKTYVLFPIESNLVMVKSYVKVGRSSYSALNRMNRVKKGSVSLVVAIAIALPSVPIKASSLNMKSSIEIPLFTPLLGAEFLASPSSTPLAFIFFLELFFLAFFKRL